MSSSKRAELAAKRARLFERNASPAAAAATSSAPVEVDESPAPESNANYAEIIKGHLNCPICVQLVVDCVSLPCSHVTCNYCIRQWFVTKRQCPVCRKACSQNGLHRVEAIDRMVEEIASLTPEAKETHQNRQVEWRNTLKELNEDISRQKKEKEDQESKEADEALRGSDSGGEESSDESYGERQSSSSSEEEDDDDDEEGEVREANKSRAVRRRVAVAKKPAAAAAGTRRSTRGTKRPHQ